MRYLLDTCAFIDLVFSPDRLSAKARAAIEGDNALYISVASLWEIMIKQQIKKLDIEETSAGELSRICDENDIQIIQTDIDDIDLIRSLPIIKGHGDPFDRLIICQALHRRMPVVSSDSKFRLYQVEVVW